MPRSRNRSRAEMLRRSDGSREVTARKCRSDYRAYRAVPSTLAGHKRVDHCAISANNLAHGVARDVEYCVERPDAHGPQSRDILRALNWTRVQQSVAACAIGSDGKGVAGRIGE